MRKASHAASVPISFAAANASRSFTDGFCEGGKRTAQRARHNRQGALHVACALGECLDFASYFSCKVGKLLARLSELLGEDARIDRGGLLVRVVKAVERRLLISGRIENEGSGRRIDTGQPARSAEAAARRFPRKDCRGKRQ